MSTETQFTGRYEMVSSENYGEYLKALGVGLIQRNLAEKAKPTIEISENGGKWTLKTLTALENTMIVFELNKEFVDQAPDGRSAVSTVAQEGNTFILVQRIGEDTTTTLSEFFPTELRQTYSAQGVSAVRLFRRL